MFYIFNENMPRGLAQGLDLIEGSNHRTSVKVKVQHATDFMGRKGASDEEIIAAASRKKAIIFTKDKDFKHIKLYHALYREHEVSVVFFRTSRTVVTYWDMVTSFINRWEDLKQLLAASTPPAAFEITLRGIQKMSF